MYSAIEGVELPPDIPIDINTLSNVLYKGKINDLSFFIDNRLIVLIEHQSTVNKNMPIRLLTYVSEIYNKIIGSKNVFQEKLIEIPLPEFI
ncbi:MAG: Rpn family recombination-promoting nuclease/putative transposase, partial [Treponema sp.]|nr:Rpn family recombination-promoting nuclease/putative transposase [Treponema sp.]